MQPRRSYQETDDWQPAPSYAPHPGPVRAAAADDHADWQAAQYARHAASPSRHRPIEQPQQPRQQPATSASYEQPAYRSRHEPQAAEQQPYEQQDIISPRMRWKRASATARW